MAERLEFGPNEMSYNAMTAAEHISRYGLLREACVGKRVLDVACGEGYGAYLLANWGAASVVAIDVFPDAIDKAKQSFPSEKVTYLVGDACRLGDVLSPESQFDLICSFETIEHLADPKVFLESLTQFRRDDCVVAISAPNDRILPEGEDNPFHLQEFEFSAFKSLTETVLGPATKWLFGLPFQGFSLLPHIQEKTPEEKLDMRSAMRLNEDSRLFLIPPQEYTQPNVENVQFWLGVWGGELPPTSVGAPQSMTSWREPWLALDYFKARIADSTMEAERNIAEIRRLGLVLAEERRMNGAIHKRVAELDALVASGAKLSETSLQAIGEVVRRQDALLSETSLQAIGEVVRRQFAENPAILDNQTMTVAAREVWREKRRRSFRKKLSRWIKRLVGNK